MTQLTPADRAAIADLVERSDNEENDALFEELGKRLRMVDAKPTSAGDFEGKDPVRQKVEVETMGFVSDLRDAGRRFFERVSRQAYELVCGSAADAARERQDLLKALGLGRAAAAPALAALLVSYLGLAPLIAAAVAAIAMRLVFSPGYQTLCETWKAKLPPAT